MEGYAGQQFVGIDLHRRRSVLVRMTADAEVLERVRIINDIERLAAVIARAGRGSPHRPPGNCGSWSGTGPSWSGCAATADTDQLFSIHVLGFKGLERRVVVLALNESDRRDRARERRYVGLSRARDELVVCGDPEWIAEVGGEALLRRLTTTD